MSEPKVITGGSFDPVEAGQTSAGLLAPVAEGILEYRMGAGLPPILLRPGERLSLNISYCSPDLVRWTLEWEEGEEVTGGSPPETSESGRQAEGR